MPYRLYQLIERAAKRNPDAQALLWRDEVLTYSQLWAHIEALAGSLQALGLERGERVAVYLPKQFETVISLFACNRADAVFIPINPQLKPEQVAHILANAGTSLLVTSAQRARQLDRELHGITSLRGAILTDGPAELSVQHWQWGALTRRTPTPAQNIDTDLAALLYTSGSTGLPKGVMLTQRNLLCGAESVADYLRNEPQDRLLAVLPLSFDYGLSQLTTAFHVGASVVLCEYLLPRDVVRAVARYQVTGLAGVPPLWHQLAAVDWPDDARCLRYFTNSGGRLPDDTLNRLRTRQPQAEPYLMYGLTEAFRSTWVPPAWLERKPGSIGIPIPNADVLVVREDGSVCDAFEEGELVHRGSLVASGYWADPERTRERFRPLPQGPGRPAADAVAVWSGDRVYRDDDGFMFFVGRRDEQIKCSGYRISPDEIEQQILASGLVDEAVVTAAEHPALGEAPIAILTGDPQRLPELQHWIKARLPGYMQPQAWLWYPAIPRNANGKYDRSLLKRTLATQFRSA
ncbi:acyl-CoA ligase (AMP-forming), exosortase A system-associated [Halopseudomonas nanhaiensis]|uniref:acyl-CoA ligase (AMP-forming), exosortase A system-associated n=1 Tax=Halopseudomonas nanhaiensis TaxID=2830842 RepID=UPI001CBF2B68|nr:acyl-CoA ligase (AMP-forming), exosortase A system-associated [Halopseudomonas nanhaiensis]UAW99743.1 acyl-CoA ligase (AMP-forming), exosortase A system-associated [Halopseudomonas nanhaiensis]